MTPDNEPSVAELVEQARLAADNGVAHGWYAVHPALYAAAFTRLERRCAELSEGIQAYLDGDYDSPRSHRHDPESRGKCSHGTYYYETCESCIDRHFETLLLPPERANEGKEAESQIERKLLLDDRRKRTRPTPKEDGQ